ncbi:uncharacterized protein LOC120354864 [Nilaparvata lugens]|uniref:uncharacterized protein LOC120354864 n=1 Tax=Nilaparvata lugens TaxID=108931 RepID=UPI00193E8288|nr:uncharacterized protein LOC120354864 [Nilaparvata lugens]
MPPKRSTRKQNAGRRRGAVNPAATTTSNDETVTAPDRQQSATNTSNEIKMLPISMRTIRKRNPRKIGRNFPGAPNRRLLPASTTTSNGETAIAPNRQHHPSATTTSNGETAIAPNRQHNQSAITTSNGETAIAPNRQHHPSATTTSNGETAIAPNRQHHQSATSTSNGMVPVEGHNTLLDIAGVVEEFWPEDSLLCNITVEEIEALEKEDLFIADGGSTSVPVSAEPAIEKEDLFIADGGSTSVPISAEPAPSCPMNSFYPKDVAISGLISEYLLSPTENYFQEAHRTLMEYYAENHDVLLNDIMELYCPDAE